MLLMYICIIGNCKVSGKEKDGQANVNKGGIEHCNCSEFVVHIIFFQTRNNMYTVSSLLDIDFVIPFLRHQSLMIYQWSTLKTTTQST